MSHDGESEVLARGAAPTFPPRHAAHSQIHEDITRATREHDAEIQHANAQREAAKTNQEIRRKRKSEAKTKLYEIINAVLKDLQADPKNNASFRDEPYFLTLSTSYARLRIDVWDDIHSAIADNTVLAAAVLMRNRSFPREVNSANLVYEQGKDGFGWHIYRYSARDPYLLTSPHAPTYRPDRPMPPVNPHGSGYDYVTFVERRASEATNRWGKAPIGQPFNTEVLLSLVHEALSLRLPNPEQ